MARRKQKMSSVIAQMKTATILLLVLLTACFIIASEMVYRCAVDVCDERLSEATAQLASSIEETISYDFEQVAMLAEVLENSGDISAEAIHELMPEDYRYKLVSSLAVLQEDGQVIYPDNGGVQFDSAPDFQQELARTPYLSGLQENADGQQYLYYAVAMEKGDRPAGILYGLINPEAFATAFSTQAYQGNCQQYIVDGDTGDFLMDTWHDELGNFYDGSMGSRETKPGYTIDQMREDIKEGKGGLFVFMSRTAGEYFYTSYQPVGVNNWSVQLTVPESVAFAHAIRIRCIVLGLSLAYGVILLVYFLRFWVVVRKNNKRGEEQLRQSQQASDVQRTLFDTYKNPEVITEALHKIADMFEGEAAVFRSLDKADYESNFYCWEQGGLRLEEKSSRNEVAESLPTVVSLLESGKSVLMHAYDDLALTEEEVAYLRENGVRNFMAAPAMDSDGRYTGVLYVMNTQRHWANTEILEWIAVDLMLALRNALSYRFLERIGTYDAVTGLKNRACYQNSLASYACSPSALFCLYIDANGLHELNNRLGHSMGDAMLRYIGNCLQALFGENDAYRIGGDEFVVFCNTCTQEEITSRIQQLHIRLNKHMYHVSVGCAMQEGDIDIQRLIEDAEKHMYQNKKLYYESRGDAPKAREMNRQLEQMLLKKRDSEDFLSIISSYFVGAYIVDLFTDDTRVIYVQPYFSPMLEQTGYKFKKALELYAGTFVEEKDLSRFIPLFDYAYLTDVLQRDGRAEADYTKKDGTKIVLRIYRSSQYNEEKHETFWLFEEISNSAN